MFLTRLGDLRRETALDQGPSASPSWPEQMSHCTGADDG